MKGRIVAGYAMTLDAVKRDAESNVLPTYSDALVGFVRALDSAEMAVRTGRWHYGDLEVYTPDVMANPDDVPSWARQSLEIFSSQLPSLRAMFRNMVAAESQGLHITANILLDAKPPFFVETAFKPVLDGYIQHRPATISILDALPASLADQLENERVVYWDGEVFVIPESFPDSFVEVWFRRAIGYWEDGGAYPLRLTAAALAGTPITIVDKAVEERQRKGQRIEQLRSKWNI